MVERSTAHPDGPVGGPEKASHAQITASSLERRALPLVMRDLAEPRARKLGYLRYSQSFLVRARSRPWLASEHTEIGLQKARFEAYTAKAMLMLSC